MNNTISHSQLEKLEACSRKYYYQYEHKLQDGVGVAAAYSTHLIHGPLEYLYLNGDSVEVPWELYWDEYVKEVGVMGLGEARYSLDTAKRVYQDMLSYYYDDRAAFDTFEVEEEARVPFHLTHDGEVYTMEYISRPDVIAYNGKKFVMDFKYSSSDQSALSLEFHRQFLGQVWAHQADGFVVYAIGVTKAKLRPGIAILRHEYEPRLVQLSDFEREMKMRTHQRLLMQLHNVWPKQSPKACYDFGKPCVFLNICQAGEFEQEAIERMKASQEEGS